MSDASKTSEFAHRPVEARPRPERDRSLILARINARYENSLRYLGR